MLSRRNFLHTLAGLGALALPRRAAAASTPPHFFIFAQVYGAWDVCLAFDPKDRDGLLPNGQRAFDQPYAFDDVVDVGRGLRLAPDGASLRRFADRLAIVNGIDMEVELGHITDMMMTGAALPRQKGLPWLQALLAARQPYLKTCPIPHLYASYDGEFSAGAYATTSAVATPEDFLTVLAPLGRGGEGLADLQAMVADRLADESSLGWQRALAVYIHAIRRAETVPALLARRGIDDRNPLATPHDLGRFMGELFASGVVGSVTLSLGQRYMFDTHANHYAQHPLKTALRDLAELCTALQNISIDAGASVMDRTTVVMTGEFSRSPRLNDSHGKDHNVHSNSWVAWGYRIKPGVFGQSGPRLWGDSWLAHAALPLDFASGRPDSAGDIMTARNLWAGFGRLAECDLTDAMGADVRPVGFL